MSQVFQLLSYSISGYKAAVQFNNPEWQERHLQEIRELENRFLPSVDGFDSGCSVDLKKSTDERIEIVTHFHHLNPLGFFDGWSDYRVIVTPSLLFGFKLEVEGQNDGPKDTIKEKMSESLGCEVP